MRQYLPGATRSELAELFSAMLRRGNAISTDHPRHGEIDFRPDGESQRVEFAKDHPRHGQIRFFKDGKPERVEYAEGHPQHGAIVASSRTQASA